MIGNILITLFNHVFRIILLFKFGNVKYYLYISINLKLIKIMKSFKIRDGKVIVDGVVYTQTPLSSEIFGKMGKILSIHIDGRGLYFPINGKFIDSSSTIGE